MESEVLDLMIRVLGPFGALLLLFGWWLLTRGHSRLGEKDREDLTQIKTDLKWLRESQQEDRQERYELARRFNAHLQYQHDSDHHEVKR